MKSRLKTRPRPRFMRAAPTILVTGTWQVAFFDPIWASYFSLCKLCQPFWLFIKYSVNMAKLSETFSPLSHSIKCLPFVISHFTVTELLLCAKCLKGFKSNPEPSDERRSRQREKIKASLYVPGPFWTSDRLLPLHPFCTLWWKKTSMEN